jgi:hypothetical protein
MVAPVPRPIIVKIVIIALQMVKQENSKDPKGPPCSASAGRTRNRLSRPGSQMDMSVSMPPGVGTGPVFVQVEVLKPKDVFVSFCMQC